MDAEFISSNCAGFAMADGDTQKGMNRTIRLVESEIGELASIAALEQEPENKRNIHPQGLDAHLDCHRSGSARYFSILQGRHLLGFMILGLEQAPQTVELRRIVVASKGKGVGSCAMELLENHCAREWGTNKIWLDVFQENAAAIRFYRKQGYAQVGESTWQDRQLWIFEKHCAPARG